MMHMATKQNSTVETKKETQAKVLHLFAFLLYERLFDFRNDHFSSVFRQIKSKAII